MEAAYMNLQVKKAQSQSLIGERKACTHCPMGAINFRPSQDPLRMTEISYSS